MTHYSISCPAPMSGEWGRQWKFQASNHSFVFMVTSPGPEAHPESPQWNKMPIVLLTHKTIGVLGDPVQGSRAKISIYIFCYLTYLFIVFECLGTSLISTHQMSVVFPQPKMCLVIFKCPQEYTIPPSYPHFPSHWETLVYPLATSVGGTNVDQPLEVNNLDCVAA